MISILVADDQKTSRQFLKISLETEPDFQVVALAGNGKEAIERTQEFKPDIIIMDINMPVMDGLSATKIIADRYKSSRVLIFSLYDDEESLSNAIEAGAKGYLFKNTPPEEIILAVRSAHQGYFQLGPGLLERYLYRFSMNAVASKKMNYLSSNGSDFFNKNQNLNFTLKKIMIDKESLEQNMLRNRTMIYIIFAINFVVLLLLILFSG